MRLWWVRHGPTHEKAFCGWRDVPADLSDHAAVARLQAFLPDAPVVSSDLIRARATADAIAGARPRLPDVPGLREFHFGDWDGMHWDDVSNRDPDLSRAYWEEPGDITPPGGESWNMAAARVSQAVAGLVAVPRADLIVVAHFGVILSQLAPALGQTPAEVLGQKIDNLSVTCLSYDGQGWQAGVINHCP
ncbi:histidine phosphatase family protein [Fuscibacter oryzae]|uniref:Histidine phosphatase family protein n=1 Tax=Fuscibacter oryzae TaxID=2803939 RepID=A0A8J7SUD4_9RHOB|nr:histidine phosphatase family protein [Fuscibacter oryzae]MBL4926619.1 histidine phosphatase family protein [Fuscibacter oryzae]